MSKMRFLRIVELNRDVTRRRDQSEYGRQLGTMR